MLALTKKVDYALIALGVLAQKASSVVSAREIAEDSGVPLPILTNILKSLSHAGVVVSERGSRGGYALARTAREITLDELITAVEGPIYFVRCTAPEAEAVSGNCHLESVCPIRLPAQRVYTRLKQFLRSVTLAELGVDASQFLPLHPPRMESSLPEQITLTEFIK